LKEKQKKVFYVFERNRRKCYNGSYLGKIEWEFKKDKSKKRRKEN
jgi:hypothetical protein